MEKESWRRNHGGGIMEEQSWRRSPGGGTIDETSGRHLAGRHHGAIWGTFGKHLGSIWEAFPGGIGEEVGGWEGIWEASGGQIP